MLRDMIHPPPEKPMLHWPREEMEVLRMLHATTRGGDICGGAMLPVETLGLPSKVASCPGRIGDGCGTVVAGGDWNESESNTSFTAAPFSSFSTKTSVSTPPQLETNALPPDADDSMMPWVSCFPSAFGMKILRTQRAETVVDEYMSTVAHTGPPRLPPSLTFEPYHTDLDPIMSNPSWFFPGISDINGPSSSTSAKGSPYPNTCMLSSTQKPELMLHGMMENTTTQQEYANQNRNVRQAEDDTARLMNVGRTNSSSTPLTPDLAASDDSAFMGRISRCEKQEKINRYLRKKKQRNYRKRIKYACRKTLADGRPRFKGRFARNDDYGGATPGLGFDY